MVFLVLTPPVILSSLFFLWVKRKVITHQTNCAMRNRPRKAYSPTDLRSILGCILSQHNSRALSLHLAWFHSPCPLPQIHVPILRHSPLTTARSPFPSHVLWYHTAHLRGWTLCAYWLLSYEAEQVYWTLLIRTPFTSGDSSRTLKLKRCDVTLSSHQTSNLQVCQYMQLVFKAVGIRNLPEPKILHITSETKAHNKTKGTTPKGEEQRRMRGWESKASVQLIFALEAGGYTQHTLRSNMELLLFKLVKECSKRGNAPQRPPYPQPR